MWLDRKTTFSNVKHLSRDTVVSRDKFTILYIYSIVQRRETGPCIFTRAGELRAFAITGSQ